MKAMDGSTINTARIGFTGKVVLATFVQQKQPNRRTANVMTIDSTYTYQQIARAIEHLTTHYREQPSLSELAEKVNLSEFHFQRLFTEWRA